MQLNLLKNLTFITTIESPSSAHVSINNELFVS